MQWKTLSLSLSSAVGVSIVCLCTLLALSMSKAPAQAAPLRPVSFDCTTVSEIPLLECQALVAIYQQMDGAHWLNRGSDWLITATPCRWAYVTCEQRHITKLQFNFQFYLAENPGLTGTLPSEIGNLPQLQTLILTCNAIAQGAVPYDCTNNISLSPALETLTQLRSLTLADNQLTTLPFDLAKLTNLQSLDLRYNQFTQAPAGLAQLQNLQSLDLGSNQFTTVPPGLGNLSKLAFLNLSYNPQLRGRLPQTWVQLKELQLLSLAGTALCEPTNHAFQSWLNTIQFYWHDQSRPCLNLAVDFVAGAPGSQFTLLGSTRIPTDTFTASINGRPLGAVPLNATGNFSFTLASTTATPGGYIVTVVSATDDLSIVFRIAADAPTHPPTGPATFGIPADIAYPHFAYLPRIMRQSALFQ